MAESEADTAETGKRTEEARKAYQEFLRHFFENLKANEVFQGAVPDENERDSVVKDLQDTVETDINNDAVIKEFIEKEDRFNEYLGSATDTQLKEAGISDGDQRRTIYTESGRAARDDYIAAKGEKSERKAETGWSPGEQGGAKDKNAWRDGKYTEELTLYGEQDGKDQQPTNLNDIDDDTIKSALQDRWTVNGLVGMGVLEVDKETGAIKAAEKDMTVNDAVELYLSERRTSLPVGEEAEGIQAQVTSDVKAIQKRLGMDTGTVYGVDGKFGEETRATVIEAGTSGSKVLEKIIEVENKAKEAVKGAEDVRGTGKDAGHDTASQPIPQRAPGDHSRMI